jgi:hypothetical protein
MSAGYWEEASRVGWVSQKYRKAMFAAIHMQ